MQLGKYAQLERERRFLLGSLPRDLSSSAPHTTIQDRYLHRTRFRLRRMVASDSQSTQYKLTQKYLHTPGNFASVVITNTYLTELEYRTFEPLAADELWKDRYRYWNDGWRYAVDVFQGRLAGLVLAEIEFATDDDLATFMPPAFVQAEVTAETAFTGGRLCQSTAAEVEAAIAHIRQRQSAQQVDRR
jgi:CYTH domain-containing protein